MAKTGIEVLTDLVDQIRALNQRIDLLDQNVKTLMNQAKAKPPETKPTPKPQIQAILPPKPQIQAIPPPPPKPGKMTIQATHPKKDRAMTSGKLAVLIDNKPVTIPDAIIKIFDEQDHLVRETKTNRSGQWMCLLEPGKYVVEIAGKYRGKELITQNKNFTIPAGVKEYEVI